MVAAAFHSLSVLATAFSHSVFYGERALNPQFPPLGDEECFELDEDSGSIQTSFFLVPYQKHSCAGSDWVVLLILFLFIHCISWWSRWLIWEPFARWHMEIPIIIDCQNDATTTRTTSCTSTKKKTIENFSQSMNAATFHTLSSLFVWRILSGTDWLLSTDDWADVKSLDYIEADFKFYYLLYAARYLSDFVSLFFEHGRSDTFAYAIHHVATIALVLFSAHTGFTRIGGIIMFFFDWADPPMLVAKACVYLSRRPTDWYQWCADRLFEIFAVTFIVTRNLLFTYVVYICFVGLEIPKNHHKISPTGLTLLRSMLLVLVLLMTFWLGLIIKAAVNQLKNQGNVEDIREEDHDPNNNKKLD